jgi:AraC-like DNA-binding protein
MARPVKTVDAKRVIELAAKGHTMEEIAALEDCSERTLRRRFGRECEKGRKLCDAQIRRKQVEKALAGNGDTTMLIWLGKQRLGQKDKHEIEHTGLGEAFDRMTAAELEAYASSGILPEWFPKDGERVQ